ncbi:MAG: GntR family transcriptional regulator [Pseudomonadota bacterium]
MAAKAAGALPVVPLSHEPLHERLHAALWEAIVSGQFVPGQKLTVRGVAEAFGTSPMPVRASLSRLVAEGALTQNPNGTVIVPKVTRDTFSEVMELRAVLEKRATILAAPNVGQTDLAQLRESALALREATKNDDIIAYLQANRALKFGIYEHAHSPVLLELIQNLWLKAGPMLRRLANDLPNMGHPECPDHVLQYIERGSGEAAAEVLAADILTGMKDILSSTTVWEQADGEARG